jgi:hypothetical protein
MVGYSRSIVHHSRAADLVHAALRSYGESGATFEQLMNDNQARFTDRNSVLAAISLLQREGKIKTSDPWEGLGFLQRVKLQAM